MTKEIMNLIPLGMGLVLANENIKTVTKKKVDSKDLVKIGLKNIVGISLIGATSKLIN